MSAKIFTVTGNQLRINGKKYRLVNLVTKDLPGDSTYATVDSPFSAYLALGFRRFNNDPKSEVWELKDYEKSVLNDGRFWTINCQMPMTLTYRKK